MHESDAHETHRNSAHVNKNGSRDNKKISREPSHELRMHDSGKNTLGKSVRESDTLLKNNGALNRTSNVLRGSAKDRDANLFMENVVVGKGGSTPKNSLVAQHRGNKAKNQPLHSAERGVHKTAKSAMQLWEGVQNDKLDLWNLSEENFLRSIKSGKNHPRERANFQTDTRLDNNKNSAKSGMRWGDKFAGYYNQGKKPVQ
jgi:hypothetical protein